MNVLVVELKFDLSFCNSLKEKRNLKLSLSENIKRKFKLNVSEVGFQNDFKILNLGLSMVNGDLSYLEKIVPSLREHIEKNFDAPIVDFKYACIKWSWE